MLLYSRDALAAPLRVLGSLLEKVAGGEVKPDAPRGQHFASDSARVEVVEDHLQDPLSEGVALELCQGHEESEANDSEVEEAVDSTMADMAEAVDPDHERAWKGALAESSGEDISSGAEAEVEEVADLVSPPHKRARTEASLPSEPARAGGSTVWYVHGLRGTMHLQDPSRPTHLLCGRLISMYLVPAPNLEGGSTGDVCRVCDNRR
jgi:hypothetical protein